MALGGKGKAKGKEGPFEKLQKEHRAVVRSIFRAAGFRRVPGVSDKELVVSGQTTDFDDVFVYENIIVIAEYTCAQSSGVGEHLKKKKIAFDKIFELGPKILDVLLEKFPSQAADLKFNYHNTKIISKVVYASRFDFDDHYKDNVPGPIYLDYSAARYFLAVSEAVKRSVRHELMLFLGIDAKQVGRQGKIDISLSSNTYRGSILPEAHSNFDEGFKVVSFYADPDSLLSTAYVLRRDGWRDSQNLYQRMISKTKIESIRGYLKSQKRVFLNNIIVTLPSDVKPLDESGNTIDTSVLTDTAPVILHLPSRANSIGVIDGQHRIFAYHETLDDDPQIAQFRTQQNLLVTGIIYPADITPAEKEKFEARLFLEINSTQTNAKSDLKQAIGMVLEPFSSDTIASRVLAGLAKTGPLSTHVQQYFFDVGKLKTSSIVSFGLRPLVKRTGEDSLFSLWQNEHKEEVRNGMNQDALDQYIAFCVSQINNLLGSVRKTLGSARWTTDSKIEGRVLTTTYVNSFLIVLRILIEKGAKLTSDSLDEGFKDLSKFDFSAYHSSQYKRMAEKIVEDYF